MNASTAPTALTIAGAHKWLSENGFDYSLRQVKRMAWHRKLPFQSAPPHGTLFIWDTDLARALKLPGPVYGDT